MAPPISTIVRNPTLPGWTPPKYSQELLSQLRHVVTIHDYWECRDEMVRCCLCYHTSIWWSPVSMSTWCENHGGNPYTINNRTDIKRTWLQVYYQIIFTELDRTFPSYKIITKEFDTKVSWGL